MYPGLLSGSEAGVDLVFIKNLCHFFSNVNLAVVHMNGTEVLIKTMSPSASVSLKGKVT